MKRLPATVRAHLEKAHACAYFERCAITPERIARTIASANHTADITDEMREAARIIDRDMRSYVNTWIAARIAGVIAWDDGEIDARALGAHVVR